MSERLVAPAPTFVVTKEYRRFAEFCDACLRYRYIGLCYGAPGVGKTLSARHYAQWDALEILLTSYLPPSSVAVDVTTCRTMLYTPAVAVTPRQIEREVHNLRYRVTDVVSRAARAYPSDPQKSAQKHAPDLLMVDEADRLKMAALEQMRDLYDRGNIGLILIGMPGIEKRLARYPQLYSRVGFVHPFRALSPEEVLFILQAKWEHLGLSLSPEDFTDAEVIAAVTRITGGNFRLIHRLFTQIERILEINELRTVTKEVVETAREQLVIGPL